MKKKIFTIAAVDNVDKNARCTVTKINTHATAMALFQLPDDSKKLQYYIIKFTRNGPLGSNLSSTSVIFG